MKSIMEDEFKSDIGASDIVNCTSVLVGMFFLIAFGVMLYFFILSSGGSVDSSIVVFSVGMLVFGIPIAVYQERMEQQKRYSDYLDNFDYIVLMDAMQSDLDKKSKAAIVKYLSLKELHGKNIF